MSDRKIGTKSARPGADPGSVVFDAVGAPTNSAYAASGPRARGQRVARARSRAGARHRRPAPRSLAPRVHGATRQAWPQPRRRTRAALTDRVRPRRWRSRAAARPRPTDWGSELLVTAGRLMYPTAMGLRVAAMTARLTAPIHRCCW